LQAESASSDAAANAAVIVALCISFSFRMPDGLAADEVSNHGKQHQAINESLKCATFGRAILVWDESLTNVRFTPIAGIGRMTVFASVRNGSKADTGEP
jgi:hypothetical protein